jgi:hypothetical protein
MAKPIHKDLIVACPKEGSPIYFLFDQEIWVGAGANAHMGDLWGFIAQNPDAVDPIGSVTELAARMSAENIEIVDEISCRIY